MNVISAFGYAVVKSIASVKTLPYHFKFGFEMVLGERNWNDQYTSLIVLHVVLDTLAHVNSVRLQPLCKAESRLL